MKQLATSFIFWAKHFNDIDHMVPIIYALLEEGVPPGSIRYIMIDPYTGVIPKRDPRLEFLRVRGVELEMPHMVKWVDQLLSRIRNLDLSGFFHKLICRPADKIYHRRFGRNRQKWPNWKLSVKTIEEAKPRTLLVVQHGDLFDDLVRMARKKDLNSVSVSHGVILFKNQLDNTEPVHNADHSMNLCNIVVMPHELYAAKYEAAGVRRQQMVLLGCPRFFPEWMHHIEKLYPGPEPVANGKLRVLFMLEKSRVGSKDGAIDIVDMDAQFKVLQFLDSSKNVDLTIKLNTRGIAGKQWQFVRSLKNSRLAGDHIATPEVVAWSQVVVASCTSAIMDPVARNKSVVFIPFLVPMRDMAYMDYTPGFIANTQEEFESLMLRLTKEPNWRSYGSEDVKPFIREFIYAGDDGPEPLSRYARAIMDMA